MPTTKTTCPYCGVGCGVDVTIENQAPDSAPLVLGSQTHPANYGKQCSKGSALGKTVAQDSSRITEPRIDGHVRSWDDASTTIAQRIQDSIAEHGADSVAFYLSGQLLTEDYYVANKLMKGFIGTANVDTNSRLCMSSAVAAYKRAFGADAVPCCYEDLEQAELIVLIGSNTAWTHPVLYQRIQAAKELNPTLKIVLIDPRATVTKELADLHLQLRPGSDGFLFQGLLQYLISNQQLDSDFIQQHTEGFADAKALAENYDLSKVASETDLSPEGLGEFFSLFANTKKVISFYSQGINQSSTGTDKCNAIINCHLASGKLGYAGAGPFSITGQPNAMGGREVGGLANMLAAHMDFEPADLDRVQRFWQSPTIAQHAGLKAVDLFNAMHDGKIKVVWIMATNPAVSLPDSKLVREALSRCETVIVSDLVHNDTTRHADIILPALGWGEKDGTVTNSERCISRQRAFLSAPGDAKPDWWSLSQVAKKMGYAEFFDYLSARDVFVEHAQLSAYENSGKSQRCFNISGLSKLNEREYQNLEPIQWPVTEQNPQGTKRLFEDKHFYTPSGKARFISAPAKQASNWQRLSAKLAAKPMTGQAPKKDTQFILNTGRLRDQWHTMTRTARAPNLNLHDDLPTVQLHPTDAQRLSLQQGDFVQLINKLGKAVLSVELSEEVTEGTVFMPIHWNDQYANRAVANALIEPRVDPVSGQPESKAGLVSIEKLTAPYWARLLSKQPIVNKPTYVFWATYPTEQGYVTTIASEEKLDLTSLLAVSEDQKSSYYVNPLNGTAAYLLSTDSEPDALVFSATEPKNCPSTIWLLNAWTNTQKFVDILRGENGEKDTLVCACFSTSRKQIEQLSNDLKTSHSSISNQLGCGSKCGSCIPELRRLASSEQAKLKQQL